MKASKESSQRRDSVSTLKKRIKELEHSLSERKQAEDTVFDSEEKFRTIFDKAVDGILIADATTKRFLQGNPAICSMLGYTIEEIQNLSVNDIHPPNDISRVIDEFEKQSKGERILAENLPVLRKDGAIFYADISSSPIIIGGANCLLGIFHDITHLKRLEEEMVILAGTGHVIGSTLEIEEVYERIATEIGKLIRFDSLRINLIDTEQRDLMNVAYVSGLDIPGGRAGESYSIRGTVFEAVARTKKGMIVQSENPEELIENFPGLIVPVRAGIRSIMTVPLIYRNEPIGTLLIRSLKPIAYTEHDLRLAERIGAQIAGAIANAKLFGERKLAQANLEETLKSLRKAIGTTIQVMASAVESRDPYTFGHQVRSADLARAIAVDMGLPQEKIDGIRMAGSIHDIGKLSIPAEILSKPTKLSEIEFSLIKEHARRGFEMLKDVESPWPLAEIVHQHHEKMDGSGYPRHLRGEDIIIEARILTIADVVEAMASHRPYRPGLGIDAALNEIEKYRGIFYDSAAVDACSRLFREKGYRLEGIDVNR